MVKPSDSRRTLDQLAEDVFFLTRHFASISAVHDMGSFKQLSRLFKEQCVVEEQAEPPHKKIDDFFDYTWALIHTVLEAQQNAHLHSDDWSRTVYIDTLGVSTTDFDLPDSKKKALVQSGRKGTLAYFEWYDNADSIPNK